MCDLMNISSSCNDQTRACSGKFYDLVDDLILMTLSGLEFSKTQTSQATTNLQSRPALADQGIINYFPRTSPRRYISGTLEDIQNKEYASYQSCSGTSSYDVTVAQHKLSGLCNVHPLTLRSASTVCQRGLWCESCNTRLVSLRMLAVKLWMPYAARRGRVCYKVSEAMVKK